MTRLMDVEIKDRDRVEFAVPIATVLASVAKRITYHRGRIDYWKAEEDRTGAALKDSTVIKEQSITGGIQRIAVFDQEMSQRLTQATSKLAEHRRMLHDFLAWEYGYQQAKVEDEPFYFTVGEIKLLGLVPDPAEEAT